MTFIRSRLGQILEHACDILVVAPGSPTEHLAGKCLSTHLSGVNFMQFFIKVTSGDLGPVQKRRLRK